MFTSIGSTSQYGGAPYHLKKVFKPKIRDFRGGGWGCYLFKHFKKVLYLDKSEIRGQHRLSTETGMSLIALLYLVQ